MKVSNDLYESLLLQLQLLSIILKTATSIWKATYRKMVPKEQWMPSVSRMIFLI